MGASASTGAGARSKLKNVSDGVTRPHHPRSHRQRHSFFALVMIKPRKFDGGREFFLPLPPPSAI